MYEIRSTASVSPITRKWGWRAVPDRRRERVWLNSAGSDRADRTKTGAAPRTAQLLHHFRFLSFSSLRLLL